jgi:hypothetical protein
MHCVGKTIDDQIVLQEMKMRGSGRPRHRKNQKVFRLAPSQQPRKKIKTDCTHCTAAPECKMETDQTGCRKNENRIRERNEFRKEQEHRRQNAKVNFLLKFKQDSYNHRGYRQSSLIGLKTKNSPRHTNPTQRNANEM